MLQKTKAKTREAQIHHQAQPANYGALHRPRREQKHVHKASFDLACLKHSLPATSDRPAGVLATQTEALPSHPQPARSWQGVKWIPHSHPGPAGVPAGGCMDPGSEPAGAITPTPAWLGAHGLPDPGRGPESLRAHWAGAAGANEGGDSPQRGWPRSWPGIQVEIQVWPGRAACREGFLWLGESGGNIGHIFLFDIC